MKDRTNKKSVKSIWWVLIIKLFALNPKLHRIDKKAPIMFFFLLIEFLCGYSTLLDRSGNVSSSLIVIKTGTDPSTFVVML